MGVDHPSLSADNHCQVVPIQIPERSEEKVLSDFQIITFQDLENVAVIAEITIIGIALFIRSG